MTITARMEVRSINILGWNGEKRSEQIKLVAVYSDDKESPNYSYSQATPNAELEMTINNPAAWDFFKPGKTYDLSFEETA